MIYKGELKNNQQNGYGIEYNSNGYKYEGQWDNNIKNGDGRAYCGPYYTLNLTSQRVDPNRAKDCKLFTYKDN